MSISSNYPKIEAFLCFHFSQKQKPNAKAAVVLTWMWFTVAGKCWPYTHYAIANALYISIYTEHVVDLTYQSNYTQILSVVLLALCQKQQLHSLLRGCFRLLLNHPSRVAKKQLVLNTSYVFASHFFFLPQLSKMIYRSFRYIHR